MNRPKSLALMVGLAVSLGAGVAAAQAPGPKGDAGHGKQVFDAVGCYECHGHVGQGAAASGPKLAPDPIPLGAMTALVREPLNQMPGYSEKVLSDQDVADIYAYLSSVPRPPAVKDITLLQP